MNNVNTGFITFIKEYLGRSTQCMAFHYGSFRRSTAAFAWLIIVSFAVQGKRKGLLTNKLFTTLVAYPSYHQLSSAQ